MMAALLLGCSTEPETSRVSEPHVVRATEKSFAVLRDTPDTLLNEMENKYTGNYEQWRDAWKLGHSKTAMDGQQAIRLLEISSYADVTCHPSPRCNARLCRKQFDVE